MVPTLVEGGEHAIHGSPTMVTGLIKKNSSDAKRMKGVCRGVRNPAVVLADSMMDREAFEAKNRHPSVSHHNTCSCAVNSLHYCTCSEKRFFFGPFVSLVHPLHRHSLPQAKLFSPPCHTKKETKCQNHTLKPKNIFARCGEGQQTGAALARGLPYISSRTGDQRSLEKHAHGRDSPCTGCQGAEGEVRA
jgi:hypothetical protein